MFSVFNMKNTYVILINYGLFKRRININVDKIINIVFVITFLYSYIYAPPFRFIPFGLDKFALLISYIYLYKHRLFDVLYNSFKVEFRMLFLIAFYSFFISFINNSTDKTIVQFDFIQLIECLPVSFVILHLINKYYQGKALKAILICCFFASLFTLYLVLNPALALNIKLTVLKYPESLIKNFYWRGFGISDGLMFSYPVIQGFCGAFVLLSLKRRNILLSFMILLGVLLCIITNARSGFIPLVIGAILLFTKQPTLSLKILLYTLIIAMFLGILLDRIINENPMFQMAIEWGKSAWTIFLDALNGKHSENVNTLLNEMIIWPHGLKNWIIGTGVNIYENTFGNNSDIGYLIRLNYGGIIYVCIWTLMCVYMGTRLFNRDKLLSILLFSSLIYLNFKADFFIVNSGSRFFYLIYVLGIYSKISFKSK